jgi:predicted enzyme related to lactoylglutathione lyase
VSTRLLSVVVDCRDPRVLAEFWARVLAYEISERNPGEVMISDPAGTGGVLYFMEVPESKSGKNRLHLDLVTDGPLESEVTRLVGAGATVVDHRQDPGDYENPDTWTVLQDPEGNEFCVARASTIPGWQ